MDFSKGIKKSESLKKISHIKIGGLVKYFFATHSVKSLIEILNWWIKENSLRGLKKIMVIGGATNILFSDEVFNGLVILNKINFIKKINKEIIYVGSGTEMSRLLKYCFKNNLSGLEWSAGLPGSVGGAVRGDAGAFGGEIKNSVIKVESIDIDAVGKIGIFIRSKKECKFGYRTSIFKEDNKNGTDKIITGVYLKLKNKKSIKKEIDRANNIKKYRWSKHPMDLPSLGSTFKNVPINNIPKKVIDLFSNKTKNDPVPVLPVAILLNFVGLKGFAIGGAKFSEKHPNFIVNFNNANSKDVKKLITIAKKRVFKKFRVKLEEEIEIIY